MSASHGHGDHSGAIKVYVGIFFLLTFITAIELLPLFEIMNLPGAVLIALSVVKFVIVAYYFMHLKGDHPVYQRLFFIPLVMVLLTFMALMSLFGSWNLNYPKGARMSYAEVSALTTDEQIGEACLVRAGVKDCCPRVEGEIVRDTCALLTANDHPDVQKLYRGVFEGACDAWANSALTGNEYCASPVRGGGLKALTAAAYAEIAAEKGKVDPRFAGFDAKSPEEKQAVLMEVGKGVYAAKCAACHQAEGQGIAGVFPPLAGDPLAKDPSGAEEHVKVVLNGLNGKAINGVAYSQAMPAFATQLSNEDIAAVITWERLSWNNNGGAVEPTKVASLR
jgi:mono/diheme cytochrome c family protein